MVVGGSVSEIFIIEWTLECWLGFDLCWKYNIMQMKLNVTLITSSAGAKSMGAIRVPKDALCTAKHMVVAEGART